MDRNPDNDLNDLEQRLTAWQPTTAGLNHDAMLFAAGRASARSAVGRMAWPILSATLALIVAGQGAWLAAERAERLALARQLQPRDPEPAPPASSPAPAPLPPDSYLALRRSLEQDVVAWAPRPAAASPPDLDSPSPPVLHAWPCPVDIDR
jgi:hypothetical protein